MSAQPEQAARETRWVDPRVLVTRANVRAVAEPDPELVASIRVHGILQPPLVYPDGEDLVLIAGHRRTAAAIAVGLERIEVVVGPRMDDQLRIAAQVSENTNRAGLRAVEISDAVEQMALLGVPAGQIAKAAGLRKAQVEAARKVAAANKAVKEAIIEAPELTLDQAAELTSWGEDPDAVADLLAAAEDGEVSFAHTRSRLADQRERREAIKAAEDGWIAKGYLVIQPEGSYEKLPPGAAYVRDLADADGKPLLTGWSGVSEGHATCPDRAVFVNRWRPDDATEVCLDPKGNNHPKAPSHHTANTAAAAKAGAERSTVIANNKSWKLATGVREGHLGSFIRAGKFSPALVDALHRHLITHPDHLDMTWKRQLFFTLLAFPGSGVAKAEARNGLLKTTVDPTVAANRVTGQLLAAVADAAERSLGNSTWRNPNAAGTEYLTLLVTHTGYQLADIEVTAMKATNPKWAPPKESAARTPTTSKAAKQDHRAHGSHGRARRHAQAHRNRPDHPGRSPRRGREEAPGRRPGPVAGGPWKWPAPGRWSNWRCAPTACSPWPTAWTRTWTPSGPRRSPPGRPPTPPTGTASRSAPTSWGSRGRTATCAAMAAAGTGTRRGRCAHRHARSRRCRP